MHTHRFVTFAVVLAAVAALPLSAARDATISEDRLREHVRYLSDDRLAGRSPGSAGEELTVAYLTEQLTTAGCEPGNPDGTFVQRVPLWGYTVSNAPTLTVRDARGGEQRFANGSEFVGWTMQQTNRTSVENAELVFIGYGVDAPEYEWNDYAETDVRGKIVVMLVNDPPHRTKFGGKAMTYYGRWTYKYEAAAAKGATGAILIHDTEGAGYGWSVVENSWSGEQFDIVREDRGAARCRFESWITEDAARALFASAGRSYADDRRAAAEPGFRAIALGLTGSTEIHLTSRTLESRNVVARVAGSGDEVVVYTAHWDHLGIGKPSEGDSIYNGALDNASGVAGVVEIARLFAAQKSSLKRSVLFLLTTAEESGLLGATYYAENPLYPLVQTVAEINIDGLNVWGRTEDMVVVGYGQSDLDEILAAAIKPMKRRVAPDAEPEKGYYYRSDHFPFAKKGVPALYADSGVEMRDRPAGWGMERRREYVADRYHRPEDEYSETWDLSGAVEDMVALYRVGSTIATSDRSPRWKKTSEFRRIREDMLRGERASGGQ